MSPYPSASEAARSGAGLSNLELATAYRTGVSDPVSPFYRPCLGRALEYRRAVGYFRSTVFLIVGPWAVDFARRGGRMRLVCSPALSAEDRASMHAAYDEKSTDLHQKLISQ